MTESAPASAQADVSIDADPDATVGDIITNEGLEVEIRRIGLKPSGN